VNRCPGCETGKGRFDDLCDACRGIMTAPTDWLPGGTTTIRGDVVCDVASVRRWREDRGAPMYPGQMRAGS
jgi:hypothetical protein